MKIHIDKITAENALRRLNIIKWTYEGEKGKGLSYVDETKVLDEKTGTKKIAYALDSKEVALIEVLQGILEEALAKEKTK